MANPAQAYLATQVKTTSQGQLLLMLYQAAIKFLKRAVIEMERKDYAKKGIYISKGMAIIHELAESLNKDKGGQITENLGQLYHFCTMQLVQANIKMDTKMVEDVIRILDGIHSAYAQIIPDENELVAPGAKPEKLIAKEAAQKAEAEKLAQHKASEQPAAAPTAPTAPKAAVPPSAPGAAPTTSVSPIAPKVEQQEADVQAAEKPSVPPLVPFNGTEEVKKEQARQEALAKQQEKATPPAPPAPPKAPVNPIRARAANAYGSFNR